MYVDKLLGFVAVCLETSGHLQFYMIWAQNLLMLHAQNLKNRWGSAGDLCLLFPRLQPWKRLCVVQVGRRPAHPPGLAEEHPDPF